jgi:hypothetical protein
MQVCVCLCLLVFVARRELTVIHFRASRNRQSSFNDRVIKFFEFYEVEDPEQQLVGEGKCPLTYYVPFTL